MIRRMLPLLAAVAALGLWAGPSYAGKVEVKEVHICCGMCVKALEGLLGKVEGVSDAKADQKGKTVTFTSKDGKATSAAMKAIVDAGFYGKATDDGKDVKVEVATPKKDDKADEVTVKGVHVCCNQCRKIITGLFKDQKVEISKEGGEVKISGKGLVKTEVMDTLRKAGFNGTMEK